jgi:hypothetical protein
MLPGPLESFVDCTCGVNDTACIVHPVSMTYGSIHRFAYDFQFSKFENFDFLSEFEFIGKKDLAP